MSEQSSDAAAATTLPPVPSPEVDEIVKKRLGVGFWIALSWVALVTLGAIFADVLPLQEYDKTNRVPPRMGLFQTYYVAHDYDPESDLDQTKSFQYIDECEDRLEQTGGEAAGLRYCTEQVAVLGGDTLGRDILSRIVYGARVSLTVGLGAVVLGMFLGGSIGVIAGYFRGKVETVLMGIMDILLAFPALLLALAIVTFMASNSTITVTLAIGLVAIPPVARLIRANTLVYAQREFVLAARALGASNLRVILREVLPNVALPGFSFAVIGIAVAIVAEGGLAYLGISVAPPTPTWGGMINDGRNALNDAPHITFVPSAFMVLTVLALNFAGDRLRSLFDVKEGAL
jgi:peptide/nickel transport system permease protein